MGGGLVSTKDVVESFIRSSGPGGQNVNKTATCVQLLHVPTGISVKCQESRSQEANRKAAWVLLNKKIAERAERKAQALRHQQELKRRRNRKRSRSSKEKMLVNKKHRSVTKTNRRKGKIDD